MSALLYMLRALAVKLGLVGAVVMPAIACRGGWVPDEHGRCPTPMTARWVP